MAKYKILIDTNDGKKAMENIEFVEAINQIEQGKIILFYGYPREICDRLNMKRHQLDKVKVAIKNGKNVIECYNISIKGLQNKSDSNACSFCSGTGIIEMFRHIDNGKCYRCDGTGQKKNNQ